MSIIRYELTIHVTTHSPLHSGGVDVVADPTREGIDREAVATRFARDAHERPILTGRSVKGAVRTACTRYLEKNPESDVAQFLTKETQARLWGDKGKKAPNGTPLRSSALTFHPVEIPEEALTGSQPGDSSEAERQAETDLPRRVGIAMNRYWGAVGDGALFVHEFVPRGNALTLVITAEGIDDEAPTKRTNSEGGADGTSKEEELAGPPRPATATEVKQLLKLIVGLFKAEQISFGGRQSAGWGRIALNDGRPTNERWRLREFSPNTREGLKSLLSDSPLPSTELKPVDCGPATRTRITVTWKSPTGILVADPGLSKQDKANLKEERETALAEGRTLDKQPIPTVPLRDTGGEDGPLVLPGSSVRGALRARASRIARTVLVGALGRRLDNWSEPGVTVHDQLADDPTLVRDLFGTTDQRGALTVLDTQAAPSASPRTVTHNAGDRWTGGVAEGALYSEEVHDGARWDDIVLELDPDRLPNDQNRRRAAWCLLGLVLAEFSTGTLPLGSRGTRGLGQVEVTGLTVEGLELLGLPGDGSWMFTAGEGQSGRDAADALLKHLQTVNEMIEPNGDTDTAGWSSYLIETGGKNNA